MDLRKYIRKTVDTKKILKHEYVYYSHAGGAGSLPSLLITIARTEDTPSSCYEIMMHVDSSGKILNACRLKYTNGIGYFIKRFPDSVENKAETTLSGIIRDSRDDKPDFSVLRDKYAEWEMVKNNHV